MGYTYSNNGSIQNYWPDNTESKFYLAYNPTLSDLIEHAKTYFGDRYNPDKIDISSEYIHTSALTYDVYDSTDYTNFIIIELKE